MGNYIIEDETNNYSVPYVKRKYNNGINKKYLIIGIVLIIIVLIIVLIFRNSKSNSFSSYENKMVTLAKEYVKRNGISTNKEMYIDVSKLNITLPNSCSLLSGVIYDGNNYTPYLLCNNYESEVINNNEYKTDFKLIGSDMFFILKGMEYYELGYKCSEPVIISSNDINDEGVYNIYYILENSSFVFTRKVIVIDNPSLVNMFPVINISNNNPITIKKGNSYNEKLTAIDTIDGDLTEKVIKVSDLDVNTLGEYKVIYSVRNSLGYTTSIMRNILVVDSMDSEINILTSLSNDNLTNETIKVNVNIVGNSYNYTKLPDGTITKEKTFEYPINENGQYEFIAVSSNGTEINKILNITNIDKTVPEGTCVATLYSDRTSINVTMTSFNYIAGYNYYIDGNSSGYVEYNFYNSNQKSPTNVYVMVKDYVGNEGRIVCTKTDKQSNFDPNGIRTIIGKGKTRLRIPITTALANKGYTVNDLNRCIYNRVKEAGPYTRYGVAAAAFGLIDCTYKMTGYVLPYNHSGGKVVEEKTSSGGKTNYCGVGGVNADICGKLGINTNWGKPGGSCGKKECWYGLNCATFVRWAMCNGGMDLCSKGTAASHSMTSVTYFPEADGVSITGKKVTYYSGTNLTNYTADTLVRMLKPGDIIASSEGNGHTFVVVGFDASGIYTAEDGYYMRNIKYSTLTSGGATYRLLFLDKYYDNPNNRNNLYN